MAGQERPSAGFGSDSSIAMNAARLENATKQKIETRYVRSRDGNSLSRERNAGAGTQSRRMCANNLGALAAFGIAGGTQVGL